MPLRSFPKVPFMKKLLLASAALVGLGIACGAAPAEASVVDVTITGTLTDGYDQTGLFVAPGGDLTGQGFTARFRFDTSIGLAINAGFYDDVHGGDYQGVASPLLSASLTINGHSQSIYGQYQNDFFVANDPFFGGQAGYLSQDYNTAAGVLSDRTVSNYMAFEMTGNPGTIPALLTTSFTANSVDNPGGFGGYFGFITTDNGTSEPYVNTTGDMVLTSISSVSAVPEPASLALLCVGLAGVGAVRRRKAR